MPEKSIILTLILVILQLFCPVEVHALTPEGVAEKVKPATVGLYSSTGEDKYYGTGLIISKDGYIITSTTVIPEDSESISVYFADHTRLPAKVIRRAPTSQSVLLQVTENTSADFSFLKLNSRMPILGDNTFTVGNANNMIKLGDGVSFSAGVVSGIYQTENHNIKHPYDGLVIETDAAVNDGQDGGGLINNNAEITGIISKEFSPLRWQGTAIPVNKIIEDFTPGFLEEIGVEITQRESGNSVQEFTDKVREVTDSLVAIQIERLYPNEEIHFPSWQDYKKSIQGWQTLSPAEQRRKIVDFFSTENLIAANQMLRRPDNAVTGIIISAEGHILTSAFNVESADSVFIHNSTQNRRLPEYRKSIEDLTAYNPDSYEKISNRVIGIEITLPDGNRERAEILGFNLPLGLALLKINTRKPLPFINITEQSGDVVLGEDIALLGKYNDSYTINTGIISTANRNNNNYFQIDALLNYGNSGGPIINKDGVFLGIATRPLTPSPVSGIILPFSKNKSNYSSRPTLTDYTNSPNSGVGMGVKAEKILATLPDLYAGKGINKSQFVDLGITPDRKGAYSKNIIVDSIRKNSPAARAGFQKGDILKSLDGIGVRSWQEINRYISQKKNGQVVTFIIERPLEKPYLLLNGKKIDTIEKLNDFILNNKDQQKINGRVFKPGITQKIYVTLDQQ